MIYYSKTTKFFLALVLSLFTTVSKGQFNISDFLRSATQENQLETFSDQISFLGKKPYRLSPIRSLEFRTQSKQVGTDKQEYGLRLNPANPWEIKNNNHFFKSYKTVLSYEKELELKEILESRYLLVSDFLHLKEMLGIEEELTKNIEKQITIQEKQLTSSFFDAENYLELKINLIKEQVDLESFYLDLDQRVQEIESLYPGSTLNNENWTYEFIISPEKLEQLIDSLMTIPLYTTKLAYYKEKVAMANYEYLLEKSNINLGFMQTDYQPYKREENKSAEIGISLGITLPLFNPNKGGMAKKKLEILEAKREMIIEIKQAEGEGARRYASLKNYLDRYKKLDQRIDSYQNKENSAAFHALNNHNPAATLQFDTQLLKLKKVKSELKREIYQVYIELLAVADILHQKPLFNFFSEKLIPL